MSAPTNGLIAYDKPSSDLGEVVPPDEAGAMRTVVDSLTGSVRDNAASGPARRDAHPKAHGCVKATFAVRDDLPDICRVGLFAEPKTYQAFIRFSNGSLTPQPDSKPDVRGMAIKVLGVTGSASTTQDFLLINGPAFFVRSAADYVAFTEADPQWRFFFPGLNPFSFRLKEFINVTAMVRRRYASPLDARYWSTVPYLFGTTACKYSARPLAPSEAAADTTSPDFLRETLVRRLAAADAAFDFLVQLRTDPSAMPIEDSTTEWREDGAPFVPVARITIPAQPFDTPDQRAFCENLSFTPWHGLPAHRPLDGINRVRRTAYETISALRHELNHAAREEPQGF